MRGIYEPWSKFLIESLYWPGVLSMAHIVVLKGYCGSFPRLGALSWSPRRGVEGFAACPGKRGGRRYLHIL